MDDDEKDYFCSNDRPTRKEQLSSAGLVVGDWSIAPRQDASTFPNSNTTAYDSQIEAPAVRSAVLRPIRSLFSSSFHTGIDHEDFAAPDDHHRGDKLSKDTTLDHHRYCPILLHVELSLGIITAIILQMSYRCVVSSANRCLGLIQHQHLVLTSPIMVEINHHNELGILCL